VAGVVVVFGVVPGWVDGGVIALPPGVVFVLVVVVVVTAGGGT
jgi:hypothetical protein